VFPPRKKESTMTEVTIRPFQFHVPDEDLVDLRRRIAATRWPEKETVADQSQGVPLATMQELARYWATDYDWRKVEAKLNAYPQFVTTIDGLDIHFIHVRSRENNALPLIINHGWPGSVLEQIKLIGPLTEPVAYGGKAEDAFDVVIPSMPGYGLSGKPTMTGWGPEHMACAWAELMRRLGYTRYVRPGRGLGRVCRRPDGLAGTPGIARHPHQYTGNGSGRRPKGARHRRPAAIRSLGRGKMGLRTVGHDVQGSGLRQDHGVAAPDPVRSRRFTRRAGGLAA
jgi:hypothetical protein